MNHVEMKCNCNIISLTVCGQKKREARKNNALTENQLELNSLSKRAFENYVCRCHSIFEKLFPKLMNGKTSETAKGIGNKYSITSCQ